MMPTTFVTIPSTRKKKTAISRDDQKTTRDMVLESLGGVVGGAIGSSLGPLGSIAGAGVGSAAGRGLSMAEDRIEFGERPGQKPQDMMREVGESALWGAMGESVGRILPMGVRAVKNVAKKAFAQTSEAKVLSELADKYGIPLNLAERSGKTWLRLAEVGLDRLPFATNTIRKARREQYKAWTDAVNGVLDGVHKGNVTPDEFAVKAEDAFSQLRSAFNKTVDDSVLTTASRVSANPATRTEAGMAMLDALEQNKEKVRSWARKAYGEIGRQFGDVGVPMSELGDGLQEISPAAEQLFSPKAKNAINAARRLVGEPNPEYIAALDETAKAIGVNTVEELQLKVPALYQKEVERLAAAGISPVRGGGDMPYGQVAELRTQVLDSISRLSGQPNPSDVRALYGLLDNLNSAVEKGFEKAATVATDDAAKKALSNASSRIKQTNSVYRAEMRRLNPPRGAKDEGNIATRALSNTNIDPQAAADTILGSPTMLEGAWASTSPDAMATLQRAKLDDITGAATVSDPTTGGTRVSPTNFREKMRQYLPMRHLFGANASEVVRPGARDMVAREGLLYGSSLPNAVDRGSGKQILSAAFPPKSPRRVGTSLGLFEEAGIKPEAQRAYLDDIVSSGHKTDPTLGPDSYLSGEKFAKAMESTGDTFSDVVGEEATSQLDDLSQIGKKMRGAEKEFGNPSGTGRSLEILQAGGALLAAPFAPAAAAMVAGTGLASNAAARAFTNPALVKKLVSGTRPLLPMLRRGPTSAAGRAIGQAGVQTLRPRESFFGVPMPQQIAKDDLDSLFIPDEELDKNFIPDN